MLRVIAARLAENHLQWCLKCSAALDVAAVEGSVLRVKSRFSRRIGAAALAAVAAGTACGSRAALFSTTDAVGGALGYAGSVNNGGNAGTANNGGNAGTANNGGSVGTANNGGSAGTANNGGRAGSVSTGGQASAGTSAAGGSAAGAGGSAFSCPLCLAQNTNNPCTVFFCDFQNNRCSVRDNLDGSPCDNGDLCAVQSVCMMGQCVTSASRDCSLLSTPCNAGSCDPSNGQCTVLPLTGTACSDGNACTTEQCVAGKCLTAPVNTCQSGDGCCPTGCSAGTDNDCQPVLVTLNAITRGWYFSEGTHIQNLNTFTGLNAAYSPPRQSNTFFSFDLSAVKGTIVSAELVLEQEHYYSTDPSETASTWDVSASPAILMSTANSLAIFQDLQSGVQYGSFIGTAQDTGTKHTTTLNANAIADLNGARGSSFSVGVHIDSVPPGSQISQGIRFSLGPEARTHQLILTVQ